MTHSRFSSLETASLATLEMRTEILVVPEVSRFASLVVEVLLWSRFWFVMLILESLKWYNNVATVCWNYDDWVYAKWIFISISRNLQKIILELSTFLACPFPNDPLEPFLCPFPPFAPLLKLPCLLLLWWSPLELFPPLSKNP